MSDKVKGIETVHDSPIYSMLVIICEKGDSWKMARDRLLMLYVVISMMIRL